MTKQMALDLAKYNIRVNATCPGFISTPLVESMIESEPNSEELRRKFESWHAQNRFGKPEEIAHAVLYLASDEASFVTGSAFLIDGGFTAGR
jgi:NAD(P)-dependent dehydrogenase (short-subunit alcohol dehydrogenase family)